MRHETVSGVGMACYVSIPRFRSADLFGYVRLSKARQCGVYTLAQNGYAVYKACKPPSSIDTFAMATNSSQAFQDVVSNELFSFIPRLEFQDAVVANVACAFVSPICRPLSRPPSHRSSRAGCLLGVQTMGAYEPLRPVVPLDRRP